MDTPTTTRVTMPKNEKDDKIPKDEPEEPEEPVDVTAATVAEIKTGSHPPDNEFRWGDPLMILRHCWTEFLAEALGVCFIVWFGTGSVITLFIYGEHAPAVVGVALTFGFVVACAVWALSGLSHTHLNPAITLAVLVMFNISVFKAACYIISQLVGGIVGSALVLAFFPRLIAEPVHWGANILAKGKTTTWSDETWDMGIGQGFFIELFLSFFFVLVVLNTSSPALEKGGVGKFAPFAVGLAVFCCHIIAVPLTGCSINPARSLGPAIISGVWYAHYIYWSGPLAGGALAGLVYKFVFLSPHDKSIVKSEEALLRAHKALKTKENVQDLNSDPANNKTTL